MKNILFLLALLAGTGSALAQTAAQNKATVLAFYQRGFNGDISQFRAADFVATDYTDHVLPPEQWAAMGADGIARFQAFVQAYKHSFPDFHVDTKIVVAENDYVIVYATYTGTFKNDLMGIKATGKSFRMMDADIIQFNPAGKAIAHWSVQDPMVMWMQLGVEMK